MVAELGSERRARSSRAGCIALPFVSATGLPPPGCLADSGRPPCGDLEVFLPALVLPVYQKWVGGGEGRGGCGNLKQKTASTVRESRTVREKKLLCGTGLSCPHLEHSRKM